MKDFSTLPYRPCVGIMLQNDAGRVFVGQRIDNIAEAWQMPQGGIDEGEDAEAAAHRELFEETSIKSAEIIHQASDWLTYDLPDDLIPKMWGGRYRGQKQLWFLMRFTGKESEINLETEHPEFRAWQWAAPESLPELIVPFKRALYREVLATFSDFIRT